MNIAEELKLAVKLNPLKTAIKFPVKHIVRSFFAKSKNIYTYKELTFSQLDLLVDQYAASFAREGVKRGTRTLLFVKPCLHFSALVFALFKVGAVPILIDPGMGRKNLLNAVKLAKPEAMIAEPIVFLLSIIFKDTFSSVKYKINSGRFSFFKIISIKKVLLNFKQFQLSIGKVCDCHEEETAAILFTSGGTGIPKGVLYTHKIFITQTSILKNLFKLKADDIDFPGFPLFSLFTITMGMTSCIPDMNPAKPSKANPKSLYSNICDTKATFLAGSPAIWMNLASYCIEHNLKLRSVKYLVMFGAPVSIELHQQLKKILLNGDTFTPYGATESLPVANISGEFVLANTASLTNQGKGTCVGKIISNSFSNIEVRIISITDLIIENFSNVNLLEVGEIGEIIVRGDVVTKEYLNMTAKTKEAKIYNKETGEFWHRIGDLGFFDGEDNLWFCGRKAHRVIFNHQLLCSVNCEAIFNQHLLVAKCALIGPVNMKGEVVPTIVVEADAISSELIDQLKVLAKEYEHTKVIKNFECIAPFPVDVRHNIKIDRIKIKNEIEKNWRIKRFNL